MHSKMCRPECSKSSAWQLTTPACSGSAPQMFNIKLCIGIHKKYVKDLNATNAVPGSSLPDNAVAYDAQQSLNPSMHSISCRPEGNEHTA